MPDDESEVVKGILDVIALDHPTPDQLLEWTKDEIKRIEAFCRERSIISLPSDPLQVVWTPVFMRPYGGAFLSPPGPLDKGQASYYFITPPDETKGPEAVESYLREDNFRAQRLTCGPRGYPGPLPPAERVESQQVTGSLGFLERSLRRGLGGLRDAGDDGCRLRRP